VLEKAERSKRDCDLIKVKDEMIRHVCAHFELVLAQIRDEFKRDHDKIDAFKTKVRHGEIKLELVADAELKGNRPSCEIRPDGDFILLTSPFHFASPSWASEEAQLRFLELFRESSVV